MNQLEESPSFLKQLFSRLLVRFKFIKQFPLDIEHINQLIAPLLPVQFEIDIPGGAGELDILSVDLDILSPDDVIYGDVLCNFSVTVNRSIIFNTHLKIQLTATPYYLKQARKIALNNVKVTAMSLISDKDSVLKNTKSLISSFLPEPIKSIFSSTFSITEGVIAGLGANELVSYLTLYLSGSTRTIFEYHRGQIETKIVEYISNEDFSYQLDENDFHEKLFADFGQQVAIKNGTIRMIFHL